MGRGRDISNWAWDSDMEVEMVSTRMRFIPEHFTTRRAAARLGHRKLAVVSAALVMFLLASFGYGASLPRDLTDLSIEDLMKIEVTSVSKKAQRLSDSAAAIFVITQDDIRRSGVTSIPEALRMVPGLQVARIDSNKWAITSRGFNNFLANKLLVLMDGRAVYQPLFAGVYWNLQDTMLEDIERIEVIRGPGATLWGANAVNGVINIITKSAKETQGGLVTAGIGTDEKSFGGLRYGAKVADETYVRGYAKYFDRGAFPNKFGGTAHDAWESAQGGFRMDSKISPDNALTLQGDLSQGHVQEEYKSPALTPPYTQSFSGSAFKTANLLARWQRVISPTSDLSVQMYYDWDHRSAPDNREVRNTFDIDLQHRFALGARQEVIWGLGYRYTRGDFGAESLIALDPSRRGDELFSGFIQDDILLVKDRVHLILGAKFEHNDYTGFEIQPNGRLLWTPHGSHTLWGSVSRAVRTPSWGEAFGSIPLTVIPPFTLPDNPSPFPAKMALVGNKNLKSEELLAYELGYRFHPSERFSLDFTTFYNVYSDMIAGRLGAAQMVLTPVPHLIIPINGNNGMYGKTYGAELAGDWRVLPWWRLQAAYTYLQVLLDVRRDSLMVLENPDGRSPHNQVSLRSAFELTKTVELDAWIRYVDRIASLDVPSYAALDLRIGWKPTAGVEVSVVGQNLLQDKHAEFYQGGIVTSAAKVPRGVYGNVTWRF
jgi:iron complex outermembrane recepter protein